jgi:predicted DNA-binding transcriptional regulator AlpA
MPEGDRMTTLTDETLLTTQQLAELTNISRQTFEGWRSRGNGGPPFKKLSPQIVRYRWADYVAWRDQNNKQDSAA